MLSSCRCFLVPAWHSLRPSLKRGGPALRSGGLWSSGTLPCCAIGGTLPGRGRRDRRGKERPPGAGLGCSRDSSTQTRVSISVGHPCPQHKEELAVHLAAWRSQEVPQAVLQKGGPYEQVACRNPAFTSAPWRQGDGVYHPPSLILPHRRSCKDRQASRRECRHLASCLRSSQILSVLTPVLGPCTITASRTVARIMSHPVWR